MAYFLFVDESGQDQRESPYEVLAGVAIEDRDLWNLIRALRDAETRLFGGRYGTDAHEIKAKKVLKTKTFRLAAQMPDIDSDERRLLARSCLDQVETVGRRELTALAQAKLEYVRELLDICARFRCRAFASIVTRDAARPDATHLRKDYAYLFERFYYFLEDRGLDTSGIVVFDELDKSQSHILIDQMDRYFERTLKGRQRAGQIIPEPFFVHSDLTTGIQLADMIAYIVSWGVRYGSMMEPARSELSEYANQVLQLRYRTEREVDGRRDFAVWSFTLISDLRSKTEREFA